MKTLEALQNDFYHAIFQNHATDLEFIASAYPAQRLATYRQTIFDTLRNALALTYPGIWKLLGEECANSVAHAFCAHHTNRPSSACLDDWGSQFPDFLGQQPSLDNLPYLKDYATYEWFKHLSYCASFSPSINASDLEAVPENRIESITLSFLPSVFAIDSDFPLDKIEDIIENPNAESINLSSNKVYAIIARPDKAVLTYWINSDLWLFISSLQQQLNLADAFQKTHEQHPDFNLTQSLHFMLQKNMISKIHIPSRSI